MEDTGSGFPIFHLLPQCNTFFPSNCACFTL